MNRRGHRGKVDGNHAQIVETLRKCGWKVHSTAEVGGGFPDLIALRPRVLMAGGITQHYWESKLIEVKTPRGKLTADQEKFRADGWPVEIVRSIDDALKL